LVDEASNDGSHLTIHPNKHSSNSTTCFRRPSVEPRPPLPTAKIPSGSIGSRLAATFSHSRLPKPSIHTPVTHPATLSPSTSRAASYESGSSNGSRPRSTTPRPAQPLITVSLSPDNLSDYKNLFTRPPQDADATPNPSPPPSSRLPKSDAPIYPRRGQTPASAIAAAHRQATSTGDDRSPSRSSRYSRKNSDSDKGHEEALGPSGAQESPRLVAPDGEKRLPPSLQRHPSAATGSVQSPDNGNSSMRSRMKPPSTLARSRPPSMPLPQPPVSNAPSPELPPSPLRHTFKAEPEPTATRKMIVRPRAHTIGSVSNPSPTTSSPPTTKSTATLSPPSTDIPEANFDVETASAAQLREALKTRNQQYDELATYVLKVTEAHVAEVTNLEKKVSALDKEVIRKDKELKGLRWIINNGDSSQPQPLPPGVLNRTLLSSTSTLSESDQDAPKIIPNASRRLNYQSDSGTESHAESIRSAGSGSESVSSARNKSFRKPSTLAEVTYNFCRTASTRRSSKWPPGLGTETTIPEMPTTHKRPSLSSIAPSPSSSTSSLLPPSPSITMSSLSAIPEGPSSLKYDNSDQEERRALRASHRISTSSMTSSSTAASSAYSANMKRSRPPSIAQVLEKSPIMDDMLEKLRPFA